MATLTLAKHVHGELTDQLTVLEISYPALRELITYEYIKRDGVVYRKGEVGGASATYMSIHPLDINSY